MLTGRHRQRDQVDDFIATDEPPLERLDHLRPEPADRWIHHESAPIRHDGRNGNRPDHDSSSSHEPTGVGRPSPD